jgi:hypothetical protein
MNLPSLSDFEFLSEEEAALMAAVANGNEWLRAVLCTLARRGVAYREADPRKAQEILRTLAPLPYYKGGQFIFDLMEWEDFMVDGPPPPVVPTTLDPRALGRIADLLNQVQQHLDGNVGANGQGRATGDEAVVDDDNLPALEPGLYLYQDVVLGIVVSVLRSRPGEEDEPSRPPDTAPLSLTLNPPQAEVAPGEQEMMQVLIENRQAEEERLSLAVEGLPPEWYTLLDEEVAVPPGARTSLLLLLHPPRASSSAARTYTFTVTATSTIDDARTLSVTSVLIIQPFSSLKVELRS